MAMEDLSAYECTCEQGSEEVEHTLDCSLWDCWSFEIGAACWDPADRKLRWMTEDELDDYNFGIAARMVAAQQRSLHNADSDEIGGKLGDPDDYDDDDELDNSELIDEMIERIAQATDIDAESKGKYYHGDLLAEDDLFGEIIEEKIDFWLETRTEAPMNFAYRGVSWVWDANMAAWEAMPLKCHCGNLKADKALLSCEWCEVSRMNEHTSNWSQLWTREGELTCVCKHPKAWSCSTCNVRRAQEWLPWQHMSTYEGSQAVVNTYKGGTTSSKGGAVDYDPGNYTYVAKCRHYAAEVVFPDGVKVWASSNHTRHNDEPLPDFGFYLDPCWTPQCLAFYVPWQDYGLPKLAFNRVAEGIEAIHRMAKNGQIVEIGCIGGHGRTGTVLACLAVIAGVPAEDAVEWVHKNYCTEAVESYRQEWFVQWFDAKRRGVDPPPPPPESIYGMKKVDKGKNTDKLVPLYVTAKDEIYCGECQTDALNNEIKERCWWCDGKFASKDEIDQMNKSFSGPKKPGSTPPVQPWLRKNPSTKDMEQYEKEVKDWEEYHKKKYEPNQHQQQQVLDFCSKVDSKKAEGKKSKKVIWPKEIREAKGEEATELLRQWAEERLWPSDRPKVIIADNRIRCSWCGDFVSWRFRSGGSDITGWVHRTNPWFPIAECGKIPTIIARGSSPSDRMPYTWRQKDSHTKMKGARR